MGKFLPNFICIICLVGLNIQVQAFAKQTGNALVGQQTEGDEFIHLLRRR